MTKLKIADIHQKCWDEIVS